MAGPKQAHRDYVLFVLRGRRREAETVVGLLRKHFPELDEEQAGEVVWGLIDARAVRLNDAAELEVPDAIAG
jgi:hypothetical protein